MTTWIDTNVLVAIWSGNQEAQAIAGKALRDGAGSGKIVLSGCVYAEFLAGPGRRHEDVAMFLENAEFAIAWQTGEDVWLMAAERFAGYTRRRRLKPDEPKRFLADFLIGAQATLRGGRLITFDQPIYRAAFPDLELIGPAFEGPHYA